MKHKTISLLLALVLLLGCAVPAFAAEETESTGEILEIETVEEFLAFARSCTLDTWSQNRTVRLKADISLAGTDFTPIATFGGTFDGDGHTISGLNLTEDLAPAGLFRYLQSGACVQNLNLSGTVAPGGDAAMVGTIAGENRGTIQNCTFTGSVEGSSHTGGIVGINYGTVSSCRVNGTVTGKSKTGGIAGTNEGSILSCENKASLNTEQVDPTVDISSIDLDFSLDLSQLSGWDTQAVASDTGGIAGYSIGSIQGCVNYGDLGYPSIGYNLGGIVGRNSGFVENCRNKGHIQGRKDVGGIVGQQEPEVEKILSPDYLDTLSQQFEQLGELVSAAGSSGAGMGGNIQSAIQSIAAYQDSARSALESLFSSVGSGDLSGSAEAIRSIGSSIQGMVSATDGLKAAVGNGVANITEDVNAISSQIDSISKTFALATEDAQQDMVSDVSDADIDAIREGKIRNCTNQAAVEADLNVGGIVGAMALESSLDPESDTVSGSGLRMRHYEVKAILQSCVNRGTVTGKRSYCGGICGRMELGTIVSCENYGSITSTGGNYVGGISGNTAGRIRDCFAKCTLSGSKYIGGIVGNGTTQDVTGESSTVSNCYAMVDIEEAIQYIGAISGGENGSFAQNFFCSDTLAGINHVSYGSIAEPISYDELMKVEQLPRKLQTLTLRFVADGEILKEQNFAFGDSFDYTVYPDIPEKEGYYAQWDREDLTDLHFDTVVTAQYFPLITALPTTDVRPDGKPVIFVQGQFQEGDSLSLLPGETEFVGSQEQTLLEHWRLSIPADGLDSHTIRYLPEQENVNLYLLKNGNWVEVKAEEMGSYLAFTAVGAQVEFVAVKTAFRLRWVVAALAVAAGAALLGLLIHSLSRKKKAWAFLILLLLVAAVVACCFLMPQTRKAVDTLHAYDIIESYVNQKNQSMTLQVQAKIATADLSFQAEIQRTEWEDTPVTVITEGERRLYYAGQMLLLEDGSAYRVNDSVPDYSRILESVGQLYALVDVEARDGVYTLTTDGRQAQELLVLLLPSVNNLLDGVNALTVELYTAENTLQEIHFTGAGNLADSVKTPFSVSAQLTVEEGKDISLPEAVVAALEEDSLEPTQIYSDDLARLMSVWNQYSTADSLCCQMQLRADWGVLKLEDSFELYQWKVSDTFIYGIRQGDTTWYLSGGKIWDENGKSLAGKNKSIPEISRLPELIGEVLENTTFQRRETEEASIYQLTLSPEGVQELVQILLPGSNVPDVTYDSGVLSLCLDDDGLRSLSVTCGGSAKIAMIETSLSLSADIIPEEKAAPALYLPQTSVAEP